MSDPWHAYREDVFAVMRQIDDVVQHAWQRSRDLGPRHGAVSVGSADYDYTLKATVGEAYLRVLRTGGAPGTAFTAAIDSGKESIRKWNASGCQSRMTVTGRYELHRDECAAESVALGFHARFSKFREHPAPVTEEKPPFRLKSAIVDGSGYCGPTCLSSLSGLGTQQVARILRDQFGAKAIRGVPLTHMQWFIEQIGCHINTVSFSGTLDDASRTRGVYLVELEDHWLLLSGPAVVCTEFCGRVAALSRSRYRRSNVVALYEIVGEASHEAVTALLASSARTRLSERQLTLFQETP